MGIKVTWERWYDNDGRLIDEAFNREAWDAEEKTPETVEDKFHARTFLAGMLQRCGIPDNEWILNAYKPKRILEVCCYAIWDRQQSKSEARRRETPRPLVLTLLKRGSAVDDRREEILAGMVSRHAQAQVAQHAAAKRSDLQKSEQAEQQWLAFCRDAQSAIAAGKSQRPPGGSGPKNGR